MDYGERDKTRWASLWTNSVRLVLQASLASEDLLRPGKQPGKQLRVQNGTTKAAQSQSQNGIKELHLHNFR